MSDETKISVASIHLREPYSAPGFERAGSYLSSADFVMAFEEDTDKMVVMPKATKELHVIPWSNIKGFKLERKALPEVKAARPADEQTDEQAGAGNLPPETYAQARQAARNPAEVSGGPARPAGGGTRRARAAG